MKKQDFEIKAKGKIQAESMIYTVYCNQCVNYKQVPYHTVTSQGLIDGERKEFLSVKGANDLIASHTMQHPLHEPYVAEPFREYITYDKNHTIKYRLETGDYIHVYSVDGYTIAGDKHAYECVECGAIYESKDANDRSVFPTDDPRCSNEIHKMRSLSERLCLCPTIFEEDEELKDIEFQKGCVTCHRKVINDEHGHPDITMYMISGTIDKPDKRADNPANMYCICGMCYCKETGKHNWMGRTNPKTGRYVNVFCMSCKMKTKYYDKIAKTDGSLRGVKDLWSPKRKAKTRRRKQK